LSCFVFTFLRLLPVLNGEAFLLRAQQEQGPTLRAGDVAELDNQILPVWSVSALKTEKL
jgi:hypothetical protein